MSFSQIHYKFNWSFVVIILLFLFSSCSDSNPSDPGAGQQEASEPSGWFWQNPLPQGHTLNGVSFADANNGTAVGVGGTILRTTEGLLKKSLLLC